MLIGPVVMTIAVLKQEWLFAGILLVWWLVSRFIRVFGYFKEHPKRIIYLPAYIIYGYANAIIKVYAFATLIENSWATRWAMHVCSVAKSGVCSMPGKSDWSVAPSSSCLGLRH